ncbi:MAG: sulfatase-like hydrolase/transferase [Plesiomonas sp.]|uniref:sulfatase-like hydrolase/transferase n=1 Tax=Plesiomonas sp. TaxID=2486279 RepID=UPI003F36EF35
MMLNALPMIRELTRKGRLYLLTKKLPQAAEILAQLEQLGPLDLDGSLLKLKYALKSGQLCQLDPIFIQDTAHRFELNEEVTSLLAAYYAESGQLTNAYRLALRSITIKSSLQLINQLDLELPQTKREAIKQQVQGELSGYQRFFPLTTKNQCLFGQDVTIQEQNYVVGIYDHSQEERALSGLSFLPAEQQRILQGCELLTAQRYTEYTYQATAPCLIALMPTENNQPIHIRVNDTDYHPHTFSATRYHYLPFNTDDNITITASQPVIIGQPIVLRANPAHPKLILNIFVDGLSQCFIEQEGGLNALMPNCAEFFHHGTHFDNCYSSGEWTYVSLASIFSGLYTYNHRLFHPAKDSQNLLKLPTYTEVFQQAGYFCSQISGDWRSTPTTGYAKGMDRILYQPAIFAMNSRHVIQETLEHLDTFGEKNNFMWICLPDLHDIADEYTTSISHQARTPLAYRISEKTGETSVRKKKSAAKVYQYKEQIAYVDRQLKVLFNYINSHYAADDIIVSLVSDHGQSYLLDSDFFMDEGRTKVPLYLTGKNIPTTTSTELVQHFDLFRSVLHCAGIPDPLHNDANVPVTLGGKTARTHIFTESVFPDAPYYACMIDERHKYCLTSSGKTSDDGMINLGQINDQLFNRPNHTVNDGNPPETANQMLNTVLQKIMPFMTK